MHYGFSVGSFDVLYSILANSIICLCAGTLITEWDAGKQTCAEFLKSEADWRALADQLVAISVHYGFDGWLLNIENALQVSFTVVWISE